MQKLYRNILVVGLLLAVMLPINFAFLSYKVQLKFIKHQVKNELIQSLDKEDLVSFQFDMTQEDFQNLQWEDGREFEYKGLMFDVVEADTLGAIVSFLCFPDKQETALNHLFKQHLKDNYSNNKGVKHRANHFLSLLTTLYFPMDDCLEYPQRLHSEVRYSRYTTYFYTTYLEVVSPPPELYYGWNS